MSRCARLCQAKDRLDGSPTIVPLQLSRRGGKGWEWEGRGLSAGMRDWAAALAQVGGAEVIHFKGKINDTINPRLGHCRGGQARIHTRCWLPGACSTHAWALLVHSAHTGRGGTRSCCAHRHTFLQVIWYVKCSFAVKQRRNFRLELVSLLQALTWWGYWSDFIGWWERENVIDIVD